MMRVQSRGFLLITTLIVMSGMLVLSAVSLTRSTTDLLVANRFVASQQALALAEAGIDAKLVELFVELSNSVPPPGPIPHTSAPGGWYRVERPVLVGGSTWRVSAIAEAGGSVQRRVIVWATKPPPVPIPAAFTIMADELEPNWFQSTRLNATVLSGCDAADPDPAACRPGLVLTTQDAYDDMVQYVEAREAASNEFGHRLMGMALPADAFTPYRDAPEEYSVQLQVQEVPEGGLAGESGAELLNSLAAFAKAEAISNGCYITATGTEPGAIADGYNSNVPTDFCNDDLCNGTGDTRFTRVTNGTFGTSANPKICYLEAPYQTHGDGTYIYDNDSNQKERHDEVFLYGTISGAGILVVHGELEAKNGADDGLNDGSDATDALTYEGLIISLGPSSEIDLNGPTAIRGGLVLSTTQSSYIIQGGAALVKTPELGMVGAHTGSEPDVQYDSDAVAMANELLAGWRPQDDPNIGDPPPRMILEAWTDDSTGAGGGGGGKKK